MKGGLPPGGRASIWLSTYSQCLAYHCCSRDERKGWKNITRKRGKEGRRGREVVCSLIPPNLTSLCYPKCPVLFWLLFLPQHAMPCSLFRTRWHLLSIHHWLMPSLIRNHLLIPLLFQAETLFVDPIIHGLYFCLVWISFSLGPWLVVYFPVVHTLQVSWRQKPSPSPVAFTKQLHTPRKWLNTRHPDFNFHYLITKVTSSLYPLSVRQSSSSGQTTNE